MNLVSIDTGDNNDTQEKIEGEDLIIALSEKLDNPKLDQKFIEETSQLFIDVSIMFDRFDDAINLWVSKAYRNSRELMSYMYLANHIMQEAKRKDKPYYIVFFNEIKTILKRVNYPKNKMLFKDKQEIIRIFEILIDRNIFEDEIGEKVKEYYNYLMEIMPKEPDPLIENQLKEELEKTKSKPNRVRDPSYNVNEDSISYENEVLKQKQDEVNIYNLNTKMRYLFSNYEIMKSDENKKEYNNSTNKEKLEILKSNQTTISVLLKYIKDRITQDQENLSKNLKFLNELKKIKAMLNKLD